MSNRMTRQRLAHRRGFIPAVNSMESRRLMSAGFRSPIARPDARQMGGLAIQTGTVLTVTVDRPTSNTVQVSNLGAGNIDVAWDGSPVESFSGVATIDVRAEKARDDRIAFSLNADPGSSTDVKACARTANAAVTARAEAKTLVDVAAKRIGVAAQRGTALFVTVTKPSSNNVNIIDDGAGLLEVQWNGSAVHSFANIDTVSVHAEGARNAEVTLGWAVS
jgi:hypothetical protein